MRLQRRVSKGEDRHLDRLLMWRREQEIESAEGRAAIAVEGSPAAVDRTDHWRRERSVGVESPGNLAQRDVEEA